LRYGFPHLSSINPYVITPFDGIFAIGSNNGVDVNNNLRPDNQYHLEDPQTMIGDYLANVEVAPVNLFLSNQIVGSSAANYSGYTNGYIAEFEARDRIISGKYTTNGIGNIYSIYSNINFLTPNGEFKVAIGSKAILHCGVEMVFLPGFEISQGAELAAYIQIFSNNCPNNLNKTANQSGYATFFSGIDSKNESTTWTENKSGNMLHVYPNPTSGQVKILNYGQEQNSELILFDLSGKTILKKQVVNNKESELNVSELQNGIYLLIINNHQFKLVINK